MSDQNTAPVIDMAAIEAEVQNMDLDALRKAVLDATVKQRVATKKWYNPETARKARQKKAAFLAKAREILAQKGLLDSVKEEAGRLADEAIAQEEPETVEA